MVKFIFKFQSVFELKEKFEEKAKNEYGFEVSKLEKERKTLELLKITISNSLDRLKCINEKQDLSIIELNEYNNYILGIKSKISNQKDIIKIQERNVKEKQEALVQAMKERKSLEKMRENEYEKYLREEKLMEQRDIDELVSFKHSSR